MTPSDDDLVAEVLCTINDALVRRRDAGEATYYLASIAPDQCFIVCGEAVYQALVELSEMQNASSEVVKLMTVLRGGR